MTWKNFLMIGVAAGALAVLPEATFAASNQTCASVKALRAGNDGSVLLDNLLMDAHNASVETEDLESMLHSTSVSWETHAAVLNRLRDDVNDMGEDLCRLEAIRATAPVWQQKAIDGTAAPLRLMADNLQDAVAFLNNHRDDLWMAQYGNYIHNLSTESARITHSVRGYENYARVHQKDENLAHTLGVAAGD